MAWNDEPPDYRETAERVCTPKQLEVLKLQSQGYGRRRGSIHLGISEETWRYRMRSAHTRIRKAQQHQAT